MKLWNAIKEARRVLSEQDCLVEIHVKTGSRKSGERYVCWRTMTKPNVFEEGGMIGLYDLDKEYKVFY